MKRFAFLYTRAARSLATLLAALMCATATACSSTDTRANLHVPSEARVARGHRTGASAEKPLTEGFFASDEDADKDDTGDKSYYLKTSSHDSFVAAGAGKRAGSADRRAITTLIKRYYAAAAASDGAAACSLLYSTLANGLSESHTEQSSHGPDRVCGAAASQLFKQQRALLTAESVDTMSVVDVHVKGDTGVVLVGFRTMPVGRVLIKREKGRWKINSLFDTGLA